MRTREANQYTLPPGCISEPLTTNDGSIWVNHSAGLFRLFKGEVFTVIRYNEHGIQPGYISNLNPYRQATYLPSPVYFQDQIYICCRVHESACVMCFSLDTSILWKKEVGICCPHLLSNSFGVFALCRNSLWKITNEDYSSTVTSIPFGQIIGYLVEKDYFFLVILMDGKVRLLQISPNLKIELDYLLDNGSYDFKVGTCYPILASNGRNIFVFFRVIELPFTGLEEYRFSFSENLKLKFQGKNSYGVTSRNKATYSWVSAVFTYKEGFFFTNQLCAGADIYNRLWQVETKTNTVCVKKLPDEIQSFSSSQKVLSIGENYYIPCENIYGKSLIARLFSGRLTSKKSPRFTDWFLSNDRIWIGIDKKDSYQLRRFPDWNEK